MIAPERWFPLPSEPLAAAWSPDGARIALATALHGVLVFDAADPAERVAVPRAPCGTLAWTPAGLVAADDRRTARIEGARARGVRLGGRIAGEDRLVRLSDRGLEVLDPRKLDVRATWPAPERPVAVAVAGDEALVGYAGGLVAIRLSDGRTRELIGGAAVRAVAVSPEGARVVAAGQERGWEGPVGGPLEALPERGVAAHGGGWYTLGGLILAPGQGPRARLTLELPRAAAASPDGRRLLVASDREAWIVDPGAIERPLGPTGDVSELCADARWLAAADSSGAVTVWTHERELVGVVSTAPSTRAAPIALDGDQLLVASGGVQVWSLPGLERRETWFPEGVDHHRGLRHRAGRIVIVGHDRVVVLDREGRRIGGAGPWPAEAWGNLAVAGADLSDDGRVLVVAMERGPARVVDPGTGGILGEWPRADGVLALEGGAFALSEPAGGQIRRWPGGEAVPVEQFDRAHRAGAGYAWCHGRQAGLRDPSGPRWSNTYHDDVFAVAAAAGRLWAAGRSGRIAERTEGDGALRAVLPSGTGDRITAAALDATGSWLAVGEDHRLHLWRLGPRPERVALVDATAWQPPDSAVEVGGLHGVAALALDEDGGLRVAGGTPLWWRRLEDVGRAAPEQADGAASEVASGGRLLHGGRWSDVELRDWGGERLLTAPGLSSRDCWAALSADGQRVLTAAAEGTTEVTVYGADGERIGVLSIDAEAAFVGFDPAGRVVGWIGEDGPSFRWDPEGGAISRWIEVPEGVDRATFGGGRVVLWSAGSAWLASAEGGRAALLPGGAHGAALAGDGSVVALVRRGGGVDLFDADGQRTWRLGHTADGGWWAAGDGERVHRVGQAVTRTWEGA